MKVRQKKAVGWIVTAVTLVILIGLGFYLKSVSDYRQAVGGLNVHDVDLSKVEDGSYVGDCDVNFIYAKVEVTVRAGEITDITILEHKNDRGQAAETVLDRMVAEQKIEVDAVAGATNSSTVLKKAVENALTKVPASQLGI